jgi:hypothetical protein
MNSTFLVRLLVVGLLGVTVAAAQSIISARAGAIHHVEGVVLMDSEPIVLEFAKFPNLPEGSVLETGLGRAEMLLTPGVIIRLSEESSVKMLNAGLDNTQLEFQGGSALVEAMEILDGNAVSIRHGDAIIAIERAGLYRLDSDPAELRVYRGRAKVVKDDQVVVAKKGKIVELAPFLTATKFDANQNDSLYRWSARRSSYLASANLSAARSIDRWGSSWNRSGWMWNPYFGLFTFIPARGMFSSPFGYSFFSPAYASLYFAPRRPAFSDGFGGGGSYNRNRGYTVVSGRSTSTAGRSSGGSVSSTAGAASAASGAGATRGSGSAVGRGSAGGGRGH